MLALLSNYLNLGFSIVTTLILTPFLIHHLGTERFGLWSLTFSVLGFFGLLDLGFNNTLVRYVSEARGADDLERRDNVASTMLVVFILMSLLSLLGIGGISYSYEDWLHPTAALRDSALPLLWILGLRVVILQLPLSVFRALLLCYQDFVLLNVVQSFFLLTYAVGAWWRLTHGGGLVDMALLSLGTMVGEYLVYVVRAYWLLSPLKLSPFRARWSIVKEVYGYSAASFMTTIASFVLLRTDPFIVKTFLSLDAVALYAVPLKISEYLMFLFKQCMDILTTKTALLMGQRQQGQIRSLFLNSARLSLIPATAASIPVVCLAEPLLAAWVGPELVAGAQVLQILTISTWLSVPQIVASGILSMSGHHRVTARAAIIAAAINLTLSCFMAYKIGLPGVALGTLLTTLIIDIFLVLRQATSIYEISILEFCNSVIFPQMIPSIVAAGLLYGVRVALSQWPQKLPLLIAQSAATSITFVICYWMFSLTQAEKSALKSPFNRKKLAAAAEAEVAVKEDDCES